MAGRIRKKRPRLDEYLEALGLPPDFSDCGKSDTSQVRSLLGVFDQQRSSRNFLPALVIAMVALVERVLAGQDTDSEKGGIEAYEREERNARGRHVNTLNVTTMRGEVVRLRSLYNKVQHVIVHELRRYDFPNMAPHATQAWRQHQDILDGLFAMSRSERWAVANYVWAAILKLHEFRPRTASEATPRPFSIVISKFSNTRPGEPAGAVLQGLAFAYYRADSPNVTIETGKVGAGSRRVGRVGDIDGWSGSELVLSIEVKDAELVDPASAALDGFLANLGEWPDATAIVLVRGASQDVVDRLAVQNVALLTRESMLDAVQRWDLNKQRLAAREFHYYLSRVQRNSKLTGRFERFIKSRGIKL